MDDVHRGQFLKGIELFNEGQYYECHDTIEEIWLEESSDEQPFLQGIIQSAVAFHHYQHGKWGAARSMFQLAVEKLEKYPSPYHGIQVAAFLQDLKRWKAALDTAIETKSREPIPFSYPQIALSPDSS